MMFKRNTLAIGGIYGRGRSLQRLMAHLRDAGVLEKSRVLFMGDFIGSEFKGNITTLRILDWMLANHHDTAALFGDTELNLKMALFSKDEATRQAGEEALAPELQPFLGQARKDASIREVLGRIFEACRACIWRQDEKMLFVHAGVDASQWPDGPGDDLAKFAVFLTRQGGARGLVETGAKMWLDKSLCLNLPATVVTGHTPTQVLNPEWQPKDGPYRTGKTVSVDFGPARDGGFVGASVLAAQAKVVDTYLEAV